MSEQQTIDKCTHCGGKMPVGYYGPHRVAVCQECGWSWELVPRYGGLYNEIQWYDENGNDVEAEP